MGCKANQNGYMRASVESGACSNCVVVSCELGVLGVEGAIIGTCTVYLSYM